MENIHIQNLISKFNAGQLTTTEQNELEHLIESGSVQLESLSGITALNERVQNLEFPEPSPELDDRFYQMLAVQKKPVSQQFSWLEFFSWQGLAPKLAFASVALIIGIAVGYLAKTEPEANPDIRALSQQVTDLREMMMFSLLEKESATDRLKAVNLTQEMDDVSAKVTSALIKTLNTDENVNVRLAALEALLPYARQSSVREELIRSIAKQNSPLVQVALADLMAQINERSSVKELEKIIDSERTPAEVKTRIRESIKILS
jgi:hypothetical protein